MTWIDSLTAFLLAAAVGLVLLAVQRDNQTSQRDAVTRSAARNALTDVDAWIERDLINLGAGVPAATPAIESFQWTGATPSFVFRTIPDTTDTAPVRRVRYELQTVSGRARLVRSVENGASWTVAGQTPPTLRTATIALYNGAGAAVTPAALASVRSVEIRLELDPPNGGSDIPLVLTRRFAPVNLAIANR